jgi:hypothetical protein
MDERKICSYVRTSSRRTARATVGGGFPARTLSVCAAGSQFPIVAVSVQPSSHPGRSGFPSPVGGGSFFHDAPSMSAKGLRSRSHTPFSCRPVIGAASPLACEYTRFRLCVRACRRAAASAHRESLCASTALPRSLRAPGTDRRALPRLHRSYGLMRQTVILLSASVVPIPPDPCRLFRVPAAQRPFPTLSLRSLLSRLGPYPATVPQCIRPFLPAELRPRPRVKELGP